MTRYKNRTASLRRLGIGDVSEPLQPCAKKSNNMLLHIEGAAWCATQWILGPDVHAPRQLSLLIATAPLLRLLSNGLCIRVTPRCSMEQQVHGVCTDTVNHRHTGDQQGTTAHPLDRLGGKGRVYWRPSSPLVACHVVVAIL
jgi:hypothetical protein